MTAMLDSYISSGRIAGVVSVLSDDNYNVRYDCAGWAVYEGENRRKMTPDTVFAIFSMTKTFTGAALMCAIDEGKISLDDEVQKFLPEFYQVFHRKFFWQRIEIFYCKFGFDVFWRNNKTIY